MEWDKLIKDLRKKMLVSQEEMADELGIAFCTLNRYENGHHEPTYKLQRKIRAIAIANGIDWDKYVKGKLGWKLWTRNGKQFLSRLKGAI